jgi:hypothetical protein
MTLWIASRLLLEMAVALVFILSMLYALHPERKRRRVCRSSGKQVR